MGRLAAEAWCLLPGCAGLATLLHDRQTHQTSQLKGTTDFMPPGGCRCCALAGGRGTGALLWAAADAALLAGGCQRRAWRTLRFAGSCCISGWQAAVGMLGALAP